LRDEPPSVRLGPGVEFDRIRSILSGSSTRGKGIVLGPGDDGCILEGGWILSTDIAIEGVHFRLDWISPREAGYRAAAAAVSDLAAMGAGAVGLLTSVAAPGDGSMAEEVMAGVRDLATDVGAELLGGDLTRSGGPLILDVVSVGRSTSPLLRSGASEGDELWVTGHLGGAAGAVRLWEAGQPVPPELREAFTAPTPRLGEARWLADAGVRAAIDLSDGLVGDAGHIAAASGLAAVLEESEVPVHPALLNGISSLLAGTAGTAVHSTPKAGPDPLPPALHLALHGGEDYELLVAAPPGVLGPKVDEFAVTFDLSLRRVGRMASGEGVLLDPGGGRPPVSPGHGGFDHFGAGLDGAEGGSG